MSRSELVQNVIDGEESALIALATFSEEINTIKQCIDEIIPYAKKEAVIQRGNTLLTPSDEIFYEYMMENESKQRIPVEIKVSYQHLNFSDNKGFAILKGNSNVIREIEDAIHGVLTKYYLSAREKGKIEYEHGTN